jgi:hypothetical protein
VLGGRKRDKDHLLCIWVALSYAGIDKDGYRISLRDAPLSDYLGQLVLCLGEGLVDGLKDMCAVAPRPNCYLKFEREIAEGWEGLRGLERRT